MAHTGLEATLATCIYEDYTEFLISKNAPVASESLVLSSQEKVETHCKALVT